MQVDFRPSDLIKFEDEVCAAFAEKKIRAPVHLDNGNEEQIIGVFKHFVNDDDWICGSWRQHYKALLRGVPPEELMQAILDGKSISLCFPKYKIVSSAIVGGILPIALGIAMGIKRKGGDNKVVCWMGEMTSETGIAHECIKYATNWGLPILFILEDNGRSVCTITREVWNKQKLSFEPEDYKEGDVVQILPNLLYYKYTSKYPHSGGLQRIQF